MVSQSTGDGSVQITVTFALGTDLDEAQVLVQNRVAIAEPRLPEEVRRLGVTTRKNSPDLMMVIHLNSPDGSLDQLYISNYATLQIKDVLARLDGVGDVQVFGARDYSMRIWLDPERMAALDLTAERHRERASRAQNVQVAVGRARPAAGARPGRLPAQRRDAGPADGRRASSRTSSSRPTPDGRITRVRDVARVELGAQDYLRNAYLDGSTATALRHLPAPGSNALATADAVERDHGGAQARLPAGPRLRDHLQPDRVHPAVGRRGGARRIFEAVALVVVVVILFLQTWRAAIIPIVAIPVSLIGTFAVMAALGFCLNNLSLFGLVLAIGIVVDDAIVVVENVERNLRQGLSPTRGRAPDHGRGRRRADRHRAGACARCSSRRRFISGIPGQFYRQFAVTIAASTLISCLVSLTLSPALGALLLKPHEEHPQARPR